MKYRDGYRYQLAEDEVFKTKIITGKTAETEFITLNSGGMLFIKSGYAWDGPSGPTFDTKNSMRGSLAHDALYQLIRMELLAPEYRIMADEELGRFLKQDGMWSLRRTIWVRELKKFGGSAADPKNRKAVHIAP